MSWNIAFIGSPENIINALQDHSNKLEGASKKEYDYALPHIAGLVNQNFNHNEGIEVILKVTASGHGFNTEGNDVCRNCSVSIEPLYGTLV